ncbi:unnamed protein product [Phytophthora fragariaefolia]|uniref:Unnamed protein product n=1 Tax=Phytophthora fragariaefolia TaxID=1490495 RepID=A0A9W6X021_9STRA|nr:unnamed protein product [Phytophthora fragariaefolia]
MRTELNANFGLDVPVTTHQSKDFSGGDTHAHFGMSTPTTRNTGAPALAAAVFVIAPAATTTSSSASTSVVTSTVTTSSSSKRTMSLGEYKKVRGNTVSARDELQALFDAGNDADMVEAEGDEKASSSRRDEPGVKSRRSREDDSDASSSKSSRSGSDRPLADAGPSSGSWSGGDFTPSGVEVSRTGPVRDPWMPIRRRIKDAITTSGSFMSSDGAESSAPKHDCAEVFECCWWAQHSAYSSRSSFTPFGGFGGGGLHTPSPFPERPASGRSAAPAYRGSGKILSNEYENDPDLGSGSDDRQFAGRSSVLSPVRLAVGVEAAGRRHGSDPPDSVDHLEGDLADPHEALSVLHVTNSANISGLGAFTRVRHVFAMIIQLAVAASEASISREPAVDSSECSRNWRCDEPGVKSRRPREDDLDASSSKRSRSDGDRPFADAGPLSSPQSGRDATPSSVEASRTGPVRDPWNTDFERDRISLRHSDGTGIRRIPVEAECPNDRQSNLEGRSAVRHQGNRNASAPGADAASSVGDCKRSPPEMLAGSREAGHGEAIHNHAGLDCVRLWVISAGDQKNDLSTAGAGQNKTRGTGFRTRSERRKRAKLLKSRSGTETSQAVSSGQTQRLETTVETLSVLTRTDTGLQYQKMALESPPTLASELTRIEVSAQYAQVLCQEGTGRNGVRPEPGKVKVINEWPTPSNGKELRQFLGLFTYFCKYVSNHVGKIRPMSQFPKKDDAWEWTAECQQAFDAVKQGLTEAPILAMADQDRPFHVVCDASDFAIGCALMQHDHEGRDRVVYYQSRQLMPAERNYPVHDKEPLAMKYPLAKFRGYLLGSRPFGSTPTTHHCVRRSSGRTSHKELRDGSHYNFQVAYKTGRLNVVADALSRRPDYAVHKTEANCIGVVRTSTLLSSLLDDVRSAYANDADAKQLLYYFAALSDKSRQKLTTHLRARLHRYRVHNGLLLYSAVADNADRVVVPNDHGLKLRVTDEYHDAPTSGHPGRENTYLLLTRHFYWPHQYLWVRKYVHACEQAGAVVPAEVTAKQTARLFVDMVFRHLGMPIDIVSDRDLRFTARFWQEMFTPLGTQLSMSTATHPQTDGHTERANRVLVDALKSYAHSFRHWDDCLPMAEFSINNSVHVSTGHTPFYVDAMRHPRVYSVRHISAVSTRARSARSLIDESTVSTPGVDTLNTNGPVVNKAMDFVQRRQAVIRFVQDAIAASVDRQELKADNNDIRNTNEFKVDSLVLLATQNLARHAVSDLACSALHWPLHHVGEARQRIHAEHTVQHVHPTF